MLREGRHHEVTLHPVPVFPCRRLAEPYLVVYPVGLQHVGRLRHIEISEVAPLVERRLPVLGILYGGVQALEDDERVALALRVGVVERVENEPYTHCSTSLADTLLLHQVADIDEVDEHGRKGCLVLRVLVTDNAGELPVVYGNGPEERGRRRIVRILPDGQDSPSYRLIHVHEGVLRNLFGFGPHRKCRYMLRYGILLGRVFVLYHLGNPSNIISTKCKAIWSSIFGEKPMNCR